MVFDAYQSKYTGNEIDEAVGKVRNGGTIGPVGPYYTPFVSDVGMLSWTNNGGLQNPTPVNIKGPKGDTGEKGETGATGKTGPQGLPGKDGKDGKDGEQGPRGADGAVGPAGADGKPGETPYIGQNGNWWIGTTDTGVQAAGSSGESVQGPPGPYYTPSVSDVGMLSWTNNGGLQNPTPVNIKGPKGDTGEKGETGATGKTGPQGLPGKDGKDGKDGEQGPKGADGKDGAVGPQGKPGDTGKSAYQYAVDGGYTGTEEQFKAMLSTGPWIPATDIKSVVFLTEAQYNALSTKVSTTLYLIK